LFTYTPFDKLAETVTLALTTLRLDYKVRRREH